MSVSVDVRFTDSIRTTKDPATAFRELSAVEKSIPAQFPGVESFKTVEPGVYRWDFQKIGYGGYNLELVLHSKFESQAPQTLTMTPAKPADPSRLAAKWEFTPDGTGTKIHFTADLTVLLPVPSFLRGMATSVTEKEISKLFQKYIINATQALA